MSMSNRERRRARQRRRIDERRAARYAGAQHAPGEDTAPSATPGWPQPNSAPRPGSGPDHRSTGWNASSSTPAELIELIMATAAAAATGDRFAVDSGVHLLVATLSSPDAAALLDRALATQLERAVTGCWSRGWQPADVPRVLRRRLGAPHARLVATAIAAESEIYAAATLDPRWSEQLDELRAALSERPPGEPPWAWIHLVVPGREASVRLAIECLSQLLSLPALPTICPPPTGPAPAPGQAGGRGWQAASARKHRGTGRGGGPGHAGEPRMLERIRSLLAKAESTSFPEEAEALTAKAQELMARYAIDRAVVEAGRETRTTPAGWRLGVDDPYADAKALLLSEVAVANRCRAVWSKDFGFSTVFGFAADLELVELLYTSLLVQATANLAHLGQGAEAGRRARSRGFRRSFLISYATRIGARLRTARDAGQAEACEHYGSSLLPVLADRRQAVDDLLDELVPGLVSRPMSAGDPHGWAAGRAAADLASLNVRSEVASAP